MDEENHIACLAGILSSYLSHNNEMRNSCAIKELLFIENLAKCRLHCRTRSEMTRNRKTVKI